ncbi:ABC transporter substrate-binding protein [Streptomyces sp. 372A]|uniref:ABC transporter substrate-binding protein n=1 Tax=Streptomyces sp. SAS_281 TaxID=3412744 RepID=UPI00403C5DB7
MRSIRLRILAIFAVLVIAGVVAWQLLPSDEGNSDPVVIGTTDAVTSLDPAGAYDAGSWAMYSNVYQSLMTFKSGGIVPEPDAAESCGFIGGKLQTYQCKLRDDLTFSNGDEVTAADVKYSFDRMLEIKADAGPSVLFPSLKNVVTEGRTITFNLSSRDATFPQKIATGAGAIVEKDSYSEHKLRNDGKVTGSGPYVLKSYEAGTKAELVPNSRYKGAIPKTGGPVTVRYYKESDDLLSAWKSGQVDVTHRQLPPSALAELNPGDTDKRVTEADSAEIRNLVFNVRKDAPLADRRVRQAIAAVIDRGPLVSKVYKGTVEPLYSLIPQGTIGHSTPFFDAYPSPDSKRAKSLMDEAGVQTPLALTFGYREGDQYVDETKEIQRQLNATGLFKVTIKAVEWTRFQKGYAAGEYDMYTVGWLPDYPDPDTFSQPLVGRDNTLHNGYTSKKMDDLIGATLQFSDRSRASGDFKDLQKLVGEDVPLVPLWQKKDYVIAKSDVSGSQYLSDGTGVWRLWELGWI